MKKFGTSEDDRMQKHLKDTKIELIDVDNLFLLLLSCQEGCCRFKDKESVLTQKLAY